MRGPGIRLPGSRPTRRKPRLGRRSTMWQATQPACRSYGAWPLNTPSNAGPKSATGQWHTSIVPVETPHLGLVLTGGGARSAYLVGVLKGVSEGLRLRFACPRSNSTGPSAGPLSAVALATEAALYRHSVYAIDRVWRDFRVHQVFKAD